MRSHSCKDRSNVATGFDNKENVGGDGESNLCGVVGGLGQEMVGYGELKSKWGMREWR